MWGRHRLLPLRLTLTQYSVGNRRERRCAYSSLHHVSTSDLLSATQCSPEPPQTREARPEPRTRHVTLDSAHASSHSLCHDRTCTHCHHARGSTQVISGALIPSPGPPTGYPGSPAPFLPSHPLALRSLQATSSPSSPSSWASLSASSQATRSCSDHRSQHGAA